MRKLSEITSTVVPYPSAPRSFGRRPLSSFAGHLTCMVLVRHQENKAKTALYVSDDGDVLNAVWVPKAMLSIDPKDRGRFIVVTVSEAFAREKKLSPHSFIDPSRLIEQERRDHADAVGTAARSRNRLRGYRDPMGWHGGRNVFA